MLCLHPLELRAMDLKASVSEMLESFSVAMTVGHILPFILRFTTPANSKGSTSSFQTARMSGPFFHFQRPSLIPSTAVNSGL